MSSSRFDAIRQIRRAAELRPLSLAIQAQVACYSSPIDRAINPINQ
jgi:hypothetical protein